MSQKYKILLVDDDEVALRLLQSILEPNYIILKAKDGSEALSLLSKESPDLVISDIQMPLMDGFQLLEALNEKLVDTPVLILTKFSETENMRNAWKLGAFDLIEKPIDRDRLLLGVATALKAGGVRGVQKGVLRKKSLTQKPIFTQPPVLDEESFNELIGNDIHAAKEILTSFLKCSELLMKDLTRSFDPQEDFANFKFNLHKLMGMSQAIRGVNLSSTCEKLTECIDAGENINLVDLDVLMDATIELQSKASELLQNLNPKRKKSEPLKLASND